VAATNITDPENQKKAILIVETMYMFYSNHFPQVGTRIQNAINKKRFKVQFARLDNEELFKKRLEKLGLSQEATQAIADALKKEATKHTVQTTVTSETNLQSSEERTAVEIVNHASQLVPAAAAASSSTTSSSTAATLVPTAAQTTQASLWMKFFSEQERLHPDAAAAAAAAADAAKEKINFNVKSFTDDKYKVRVTQDGLSVKSPKYSDGYHILFSEDGMSFAWGKQHQNILRRLEGKGDHLEQVIGIKDITDIPDLVDNPCKRIPKFTDGVNHCITVERKGKPTWVFSFDDPNVRNDFYALLKNLKLFPNAAADAKAAADAAARDAAEARAAAQAKAAADAKADAEARVLADPLGNVDINFKFGGYT
jgi:chemotaxis protein histidine kinase CheA